MDDSDFGGGLIVLAIGLVLIGIVIYILVLAATAIVGAGAAAGTAYGGYKAIRNYASSFKENVIDSNRMAA